MPASVPAFTAVRGPRILLDARTILGPNTGDRSYWLGLCGALPAAWPAATFLVALDAAPPAGLLPAAPNLQVVVATQPRGKLWAALALPQLAARHRADLVHLQYVAPPWLPCPFVTTVHDISFALCPELFTWRDGVWLRRLVPPTVRRAAAVIADSACTRQDLLSHYRLRPEQVHTVSLGLAAAFAPQPPERIADVRRRYGLPPAYLLSVGVLQPRKNLAGLLRAYAQARAQYGLQASLVVVGKTGWLADEIQATARELHLGPEQVLFTGYVPDADLPPLYAGALLSVYPSLYEGFGLPPLESLACGTPVVVSDTPALLETAGPVAPALPARDTTAWAQTMARLADDAGARAGLAARGSAWAAAFTWRRSAWQHRDVYAGVLARESR